MQYAEFLKAVEERSGLVSDEEAERTAVAVVQALCDHLAGGQSSALLSQLPAELQQRVEPTEAATELTPDELVDRVATETSVTTAEARDHVRGVLGAVHEAVGAAQVQNLLARLDREYGELLA